MNKTTRLLRSYWYVPAALAVTVGVWMGCTPQKGSSLGALPKAAFTLQGGGSSNTVVLTNTSVGSTISYWSINGGGMTPGQTDTVSFTFAGTYTITQYVAGHGGLDSTSQQVTINQNNVAACGIGVQGFLSGCSSKTWMLNPVANAEGIGPTFNSSLWWGNGAAEPTGDRVCDFNDSWTFDFNSSATMVYNNQGDYYTENYLGNANYDCDVNADLSATDKPWASGTFSYQLIPNKGSVPGLGQLEVIGLGAHIGLARVQNGSDLNTDVPVGSVTYDIVDTAHDASGNAYLTISINGTGGDWWTWVLKSSN